MAMTEGEIRMQSQMYSLVAELEAAKAELISMQLMNVEYEKQGKPVWFTSGQFVIVKEKLERIAKKLRDDI